MRYFPVTSMTDPMTWVDHLSRRSEGHDVSFRLSSTSANFMDMSMWFLLQEYGNGLSLPWWVFFRAWGFHSTIHTPSMYESDLTLLHFQGQPK